MEPQLAPPSCAVLARTVPAARCRLIGAVDVSCDFQKVDQDWRDVGYHLLADVADFEHNVAIFSPERQRYRCLPFCDAEGGQAPTKDDTLIAHRWVPP